jgi:hypothetical protein
MVELLDLPGITPQSATIRISSSTATSLFLTFKEGGECRSSQTTSECDVVDFVTAFNATGVAAFGNDLTVQAKVKNIGSTCDLIVDPLTAEESSILVKGHLNLIFSQDGFLSAGRSKKQGDADFAKVEAALKSISYNITSNCEC